VSALFDGVVSAVNEVFPFPFPHAPRDRGNGNRESARERVAGAVFAEPPVGDESG
jgi:hypothetical protein